MLLAVTTSTTMVMVTIVVTMVAMTIVTVEVMTLSMVAQRNNKGKKTKE